MMIVLTFAQPSDWLTMLMSLIVVVARPFRSYLDRRRERAALRARLRHLTRDADE